MTDITSSTDICNLALDLLSVGNVVDIERQNPNATEELCARWYDQSRRKLLREHSWNFATKRAQLAADNTTPAFGFNKAFPVPADFVRLLSIHDNSFEREVIVRANDYQFEGGKLLISNTFGDSDILNIRYVYDIKAVSAFDPLFIDLLAHDIAIALAYKSTETNTNVQRIEDLKRSRGQMARAIDGQERPPTLVQRSVSRAARRNVGAHVNSHRVIFD